MSGKCRYFNRRLARFGALVLLSVAGACTWDAANQVGTGRFNADMLRDGGLIVGGVTARDATQSEDRRLARGRLMGEAFRMHYPDMAVVTVESVHRALGRSMFGQMHDSYRFHGTGGAVFMNALADRFPDTRYVAFARIEDAQVERRRHRPASGTGIELHTLRAVTVSMRLFDLHNRQTLVWAAALQGADSAGRRVTGDFSEDALEPLYPDPPPVATVMEQVLNRMIAGMGNG